MCRLISRELNLRLSTLSRPKHISKPLAHLSSSDKRLTCWARPIISPSSSRYLSQYRRPRPESPTTTSNDTTSSGTRANNIASGSSSLKTTIREDIYTLPNLLTLSRLLAAPLIGYLVLSGSHGWALTLFAYAGVTDLLDGYIARRWNRTTVLGTILDPMADKCLMTISTVCLTVTGAMPGRSYTFAIK